MPSLTNDRTITVAVLAYPDVNSLDVTGPLQVFASADRFIKRFADERHGDETVSFKTDIIGLEPGPVRTGAGFHLVASRGISEPANDIDILLVAGGDGCTEQMKNGELLNWIRQMEPRVSRTGSVCTGAFILAAAGLLENRRATSHWRYCSVLQSMFPDLIVEPDAIFIKDGNVYTSGGVTAGIDLALAILEEECGPKLALATAREIVACKVRGGGQSQYSTGIDVHFSRQSSLSGLLNWISENLNRDLAVEILADHAAMSPRNFARVFVRETGITPAKFVERSRMEAARLALEETSEPLSIIARKYGFGHPETMRRVFMRHLGTGPLEYRRRFQLPLENSHMLTEMTRS